jgi:hypothetical protein
MNLKTVAAWALSLASIAGTGMSAGAGGTAQTLALPDCAGKPAVKPVEVVLACADAGVIASALAWTGWGEPFTAARGVASVNDCDPNCAAGHRHTYQVVLIADGRQTCPGGRPAYARVTYAFIGRSPYPQNAPGTTAPALPYHCGPR